MGNNQVLKFELVVGLQPIIFDLTIAIKLYYPSIKQYMLMDDASYSGQQLFNGLIYRSSPHLLFYHNDSYININNNETSIYDKMHQCNWNVFKHFFLPHS